MTHTAGSWTAEIGHMGGRVVSDAAGYPNDGWMICGSMCGPDAEANARLIAAAPVMLKALQDAVQSCLNCGGDGNCSQCSKQRDAIAKATGAA